MTMMKMRLAVPSVRGRVAPSARSGRAVSAPMQRRRATTPCQEKVRCLMLRPPAHGAIDDFRRNADNRNQDA